MTGSCVAPNFAKESPITFLATVRQSESKSVLVKNPSNQRWTVRSRIGGENGLWWRPTEELTVIEPGQSKLVEFIYSPLSMTTAGHRHEATVFIQLPDGQGLCYQFLGTAEAPKPITLPQREIHAKSKFIEKLEITNWLSKQQRLRVDIEITKPEKYDRSISFKGLDHMDLKANQTKDYTLEILSLKEISIAAKITFRNPNTEEFIHYTVSYRVIPSENIELISLATQVRKAVPATVKIDNPLGHSVTLNTDTKLSEINVPPSFVIPPNSNGSCSFEFQPLKEGLTQGRLTVNSNELGSFLYDLRLTVMDHNHPLI